MLKDISNLVEDLNESNSVLDKKEVLKQYPQCKELLKYIYSPFTQFNVTSKNLKKRNDLVEENSYSNIIDLLDDLNNLVVTGHKAISVTNGFIEDNEDYKDIIYRIIDKNLKTRTDAKILNQVWPGLVPEFKVALANKYEDQASKIDFRKETWFASRKMDGCVECNTVVEFEDGKKLKIGDVVENEIEGKVKSYNTITKSVEYMPIKNWMKNYNDINNNNDEWYEIELENNVKIVLTGNHRLWCDNLDCWRRADELDGTEVLLFY